MVSLVRPIPIATDITTNAIGAIDAVLGGEREGS